jgi:FdhE protein
MTKIEEILGSKRLDLTELFKKGIREQRIEQVAEKLALDKKVFLFLFQESVRPSIEIAVAGLHAELPPGAQLKGSCPLCGSLPSMSLLKEEGGKRFLFCPHCAYQWQVERLACPFCSNNEHETLHYFYAEGEEACRIDLCDKCHHYIKTIDLRKMDALDPILEDIATLHLDQVASEKGYRRPSPNPWTT